MAGTKEWRFILTKVTWSSFQKVCHKSPSILGPILFNIFMNDMFIFIDHCNSYNYADDNSMSASAKSIDEVTALLKNDCDNALNWSTSTCMKASHGKFEFMIVSPHDVTDKEPELLVNDVVLKPEASVKVLVITIDSRLNFSQHASNVCTKGAWQLNALRRISRYIDETSRNMIYDIVRSYFKFSLWSIRNKIRIVWAISSKSRN